MKLSYVTVTYSLPLYSNIVYLPFKYVTKLFHRLSTKLNVIPSTKEICLKLE